MKKRKLFLLQVIITFVVSVLTGNAPWGRECLYDYAGYFLSVAISYAQIGLVLSVGIRLAISYGLCAKLNRHPVICISLDLLVTLLIFIVNCYLGGV